MSPTTEHKDTPPEIEVIKAARVVTGYELGAGLGLLAVAVAIPVSTVLWWGRPGTFAEFISIVVLAIYMFTVIATFAVIVLWGLGRLDLPHSFMKWLGGATVGEVVGLLVYVLKQG